jgi:hypothetical protein
MKSRTAISAESVVVTRRLISPFWETANTVAWQGKAIVGQTGGRREDVR